MPDFLTNDTDRIETDSPNKSSTVACLFSTAVTFLTRRFLAKARRYTQRLMEEFMGKGVQMS
jgi:hypothetical protein